MRAYIIHGYSASKKDHWFEWLKSELEKLNINTTILTLPSPNDPKPNEWQTALEEQIKDIDENTYFVTHSLGSISFLKYILSLKDIKKIAGYILVSPFNDSLPLLKQLDSFLEPSLDYDKLQRLTKNKTIISAKDDTIVPISLSKSLSGFLNSNFIEVEKGGHFLASDGFKEFPLLLKEFKKLLS